MNNEIVTKDLARFGYRELAMAGELLTAYAKNGHEAMGDGVEVWMNTNSGYVFLMDEDYTVVMLDDEKLKVHLTCVECGHEGFKEEGFCSCSTCEDCTKADKFEHDNGK